ncbi:hypothetical protein P2E05_12320 [Providencia stuartii]|uniref:hypothetical protein n=1 Tax=Providencia stuartii TaxID=588 RepID=UPI0023E0E7CC|nr:hypothetical protein [Providencia stuartii]ELR5143342.1 hypothetical protein [Providencia stuartii]WER20893.1 hypothetical protein P2E04_12315 [Providencia stuartii]WER25013.1 hypothetical protein P2E05_12320 [Providencia stuartii]WER29103.1 hypothetical protein P2E06_12320 [Providencia stuartii]
MTQEKNVPRSRLTASGGNKRLIPMRLLESENIELEVLAEQESRSKSAMARLVFLEGLKVIAQR